MATVLITGSGGAVGQGIIKALSMGSKEFRLIGVDADPYAACFMMKGRRNLLKRTYVVSNADHPNYVSEIATICHKEEVDVVFPGTDAELVQLASSRDRFSEFGCRMIISSLETVKICRDKWLTYNRLREDLPMVKSALPENGVKEGLEFCGLPAMIKPRLGWGSRDLHKVESVEEAQILARRISRPIIQKWLEGEEYTVDGLTSKHGEPICIVPRRRIKVLAGVSIQGVTVRDNELIEIGKALARHLEILGPFNFQAIRVDGKPEIFEINPRFAGTGILSVKAGANIPMLAVKDSLDQKLPTNVDFQEDIFCFRHFQEAFLSKSELARMMKKC